MQGRIKLKIWLMVSGKRQSDLAKVLGVGENTVSNWMKGRAKPNRTSATLIEKFTEGEVKTSDWSEE